MGRRRVILLDTYVLVWVDEGSQRVGAKSRRLIDDALHEDALGLSAISFWEVAELVHKGRVQLKLDLADWRRELLEYGLEEIPVTGSIGIQVSGLENFHGDPADRLIIATALERRATLVTADERMLGWYGDVPRQDARN